MVQFTTNGELARFKIPFRLVDLGFGRRGLLRLRQETRSDDSYDRWSGDDRGFLLCGLVDLDVSDLSCVDGKCLLAAQAWILIFASIS